MSKKNKKKRQGNFFNRKQNDIKIRVINIEI